jgi:hypothetical protein
MVLYLEYARKLPHTGGELIYVSPEHCHSLDQSEAHAIAVHSWMKHSIDLRYLHIPSMHSISFWSTLQPPIACNSQSRSISAQRMRTKYSTSAYCGL